MGFVLKALPVIKNAKTIFEIGKKVAQAVLKICIVGVFVCAELIASLVTDVDGNVVVEGEGEEPP